MNNAEELPAYGAREELTIHMVGTIANAVAPLVARFMELGNVDLSKGRARIDEYTVCFWRLDGHRITVNVRDAIICYASARPDPTCPTEPY